MKSRATPSLASSPRTTRPDGRVQIGDVAVNGALRAFDALTGDLVVNGFTATGSVGAITVGQALQPDPVLADPASKIGGAGNASLRVSAVIVGDGFKLETPGRLAAFVARSIGDGTISARTIGTVQTRAGDLAADITALGGIGKVSVVGGDFSGGITSLTGAATLRTAPALGSLVVRGGDFTGDVRVLGNAGPMGVVPLRGIGGDLSGASINAATIASLVVGKNLVNSHVLAGADLGADHAPDGIRNNLDTFARGAIGPVIVVDSVSSSVLAAGLDPVNAIFHDAVDAIIGGLASRIASITIRGTASPDSYFAAARFIRPVKIAGARIDAAADPRFLVG